MQDERMPRERHSPAATVYRSALKAITVHIHIRKVAAIAVKVDHSGLIVLTISVICLCQLSVISSVNCLLLTLRSRKLAVEAVFEDDSISAFALGDAIVEGFHIAWNISREAAA